MKFAAIAIVLTAVVTALFDTAALAIRSHLFNLGPMVIHAGYAFVIYLVVVAIAALVVHFIPARWAFWRLALFLVIVAFPNAYSYIGFFQTVSYFKASGRVLVDDSRITLEGFKYLLVALALNFLVASVATLTYFLLSSRRARKTRGETT